MPKPKPKPALCPGPGESLCPASAAKTPGRHAPFTAANPLGCTLPKPKHMRLCLRKLYLTWHNDGEGCWNIRWAVENPDGRTLDFREATAKTYDDLQGVLNRAVNDVAATCAHCGVPSPTAP